MNIVLYDDHQAILKGLSRSILALDNDHQVLTFDKSFLLQSYVKQNGADIIVLDLISEDDYALEMISQKASFYPHALLVVYSSVSLLFIQEEVSKLGVDLFIHKSTPVWSAAAAIMDKHRSWFCQMEGEVDQKSVA